MRIVQPRTMAEIDRLAQEEYGISGLLLMENAGIKAFQQFLREWKEQDLATGKKNKNRNTENEAIPAVKNRSSLLFIAGGGNNGGDALVMARQAFLQGPFQIKVLLRGAKMNEQVQIHYHIVTQLGIPVMFWEEDEAAARRAIREADVLFDGISGTGISGALRGTAAAMVESLNKDARGYVVAIDVPSGLGDNFLPDYPAVKADLTLTMGLPKVSLYTPAGRPHGGIIRTIKLGFPPQLLTDVQAEGENARGELIVQAGGSSFQPQDYKNVRGHAAIWAGTTGTTGAAALAAEGACRAGAGLVSVYADQEIYSILAGKLSEVMVRPRQDSQTEDLSTQFSALLAGPGWGRTGRSSILDTLLKSTVPGVIDADGIHVFRLLWDKMGADTVANLTQGRWILTPHPGEYIALVKDSKFEVDKDHLFGNPLAALSPLARELNTVIVLKCHVVWIVSPEGTYAVVDGMNPAMGTGGSGDVLAGIITGILASGISPFEAAWRGAALHQAAGRRAYRDCGWFLAGELAEAVSKVGGDEDELVAEI